MLSLLLSICCIRTWGCFSRQREQMVLRKDLVVVGELYVGQMDVVVVVEVGGWIGVVAESVWLVEDERGSNLGSQCLGSFRKDFWSSVVDVVVGEVDGWSLVVLGKWPLPRKWSRRCIHSSSQRCTWQFEDVRQAKVCGTRPSPHHRRSQLDGRNRCRHHLSRRRWNQMAFLAHVRPAKEWQIKNNHESCPPEKMFVIFTTENIISHWSLTCRTFIIDTWHLLKWLMTAFSHLFFLILLTKSVFYSYLTNQTTSKGFLWVVKKTTISSLPAFNLSNQLDFPSRESWPSSSSFPPFYHNHICIYITFITTTTMYNKSLRRRSCVCPNVRANVTKYLRSKRDRWP